MAEKKDIRTDYEDRLAETIRNAIINNDSKWEKRWNSFDIYPQNGNTGRPYSGINELNLYFSRMMILDGLLISKLKHSADKLRKVKRVD